MLEGLEALQAASNIHLGPNIAAIVSVGMGLAFGLADWRSATNRYFSLFLILAGVSIFGNVNFIRGFEPDQIAWWSGIFPISTALAMMFSCQWVIQIRKTVPHSDQITNTRFGDSALRLGQFLAFCYGVLSFTFQEQKVEYFLGRYSGVETLLEPGFWLFAAPIQLAMLCTGAGTIITLRRKPDILEVRRLVGFFFSAPLLCVGLILPDEGAGTYAFVIGLIGIMIANVQFHILHAQRGAFMQRFLPKEVATLVSKQGLGNTVATQHAEISVVSCDLRGFTAYAEATESCAVIDLLGKYYELVGTEAARAGATIKDYAGDGVLMLLGAPLPCEKRAETALDLAEAITHKVSLLLEDLNAQSATEVGIGVGVASGSASVGVVGSHRLEYVAVGSVVNRASRLCDKALNGEVLIDECTKKLLDDGCPTAARLVDREVGELKGMEGVLAWRLSSALRL